MSDFMGIRKGSTTPAGSASNLWTVSTRGNTYSAFLTDSYYAQSDYTFQYFQITSTKPQIVPNQTTGSPYTFVDSGSGPAGGTDYITVSAVFTYTGGGGGTHYLVQTSADPSAGGTTFGGGTFSPGDSCTVEAYENDGYVFSGWYIGNTLVSSSQQYTFTVNSNVILTARFSVATYTVTTTSDPAAGGATAGGGTFTYGDTAWVRAVAARGYAFDGWYSDGVLVSSQAYCTFTVTEDIALTAKFIVETYTITTASDPAAGGTTSGGGTFTYGQVCTVTATPSQGYMFDHWSVSSPWTSIVLANPESFIVTTSLIWTAIFKRVCVVSATVRMIGNVTPGSVSIDDGAAASTVTKSFTEGSTATLHASPAQGYKFAYWEFNGSIVSSSADHTIDVNNYTSTDSYTAVFAALSSVVISCKAVVPEGGTVSGGGVYTEGQPFALSATANSDFWFDGWTSSLGRSSNSATFTEYATSSDEEWTAHFSSKYLVLNVDVNTQDAGTVSITSSSHDVTNGKQFTKKYSTSANPYVASIIWLPAGKKFWKWRLTENGVTTETTSNPLNFTIHRATATEPWYTLDLVAFFSTDLIVNSSNVSSPVRLVYDDVAGTDQLVADY